MRDEHLLFVGGANLMQVGNHRVHHVAAYLAQRFRHMDSVGFTQFYTGSGPSTAPPWTKARVGLTNLLHSRVQVSSSNGSGGDSDSVRAEGTPSRAIVVRDLYTPRPLNLLVQTFWRYLNLRPLLEQAYDVAIFGHPENAPLARILQRSGRIRYLIYDDWDYFPGWYPDRFSQQRMAAWERWFMQHAETVITINAMLAQRRIHQGARDVCVVPNGVDVALFAPAREKVPHPPTLTYMGSLSPLWQIDLAIRAMPAILQAVPSSRLLIAGTGPVERELRVLSQFLGLGDHVRFLGLLPYRALPRLLAETDVGIVTSLATNEFRKYASPLKLIEYMAAGLPVIATRVGQIEATLQEADAGILIEGGEAEVSDGLNPVAIEAFAAAAQRLLTDTAFHTRCARAAVMYVEDFDWNHVLEHFYDCMLRVLLDEPRAVVDPLHEGVTPVSAGAEDV